jgi:hypothetical protein
VLGTNTIEWRVQMRGTNPFDACREEIKASSPRVTAFLQSAMRELPIPTSLRERNVQQLLLAERMRGQFGLEFLECVEAVSATYGTKFPH